MILGIDPGSSSGAICRFDPTGQDPMLVENMPDTMLDMYRRIDGHVCTALCGREPLLLVLEDVGGSRPGNSAKSSRTFAEHCGALRLTMDLMRSKDTLRVHTVRVLPRKWMYDLFGSAYPSGNSNKDKRKQYIYDLSLIHI